MSWGASNWLWMLLVLPPLAWGLWLGARSKRKRFERFAKPETWKRIAPELDFNAQLKKGCILLLALAFILVAAARPRWGKQEESVRTRGTDIVIALDLSNSMRVEDIAPSRMKKGRHVIDNLVNQLSGDRVGIVGFAASSFLACPLTTDLEYVKETLATLDPSVIQNQGTNIGLAIETAVRALDRGAESPEDAKGKAIVIVSDGEDHEEAALEAARKTQEAGIRLYVLGVGTEKGGPIATRDEGGVLRGFKRDRKGEAVISRFRPDTLMGLAKAGGGQYWTVTDAETEVNQLARDLGGLERDESSVRTYVVYQERFQIPLLIGILLILTAFSFPARKIVGCLFVFGLLAGGFSPREARADELRGYLENQKGVKAFNDGKLDDARKSFGNAQAYEPDSPSLMYNNGVVDLKGGNVDRAIEEFSSAAQGSKQSDPKLSGKSYFNLGSALQTKGDIQGARRGYLEALRAARTAGAEDLERDARKNLELLAKQEEQQKQGQSQEKKDSEQGKKDEEQKKQDEKKSEPGDSKKQDSKDEKDPSEQKKPDEPKQYKDPSQQGRKKFRSEKLSKEDAERVMNELSSREQELQQRLRRQKGSPQGSGKDW